jgi:hypothetical protein
VTRVLREHSTAYRFLRVTIDNAPALNGLLYRVGLMGTPPAVPPGTGGSFGFYEIYRAQYRPAVAEAWAITEAFILETRRLAGRSGARFGVVIVAHAWEVYPELWERVLDRVPGMRAAALDLDRPSRRLAAFCAEHGIAHVNLLPPFREQAPRRPRLFIPDDAHWTDAGHQLAAELLAGPVAALLRTE